MMEDYQFYQKYANMPLEKRMVLIGGTIDDPLTPSIIYKRVKKIDNKIRPDLIEKNNLLKVFENYERI